MSSSIIAEANAAVSPATIVVPPPARPSTVTPPPLSLGLLPRLIALDISFSLRIHRFFRPFVPHSILKLLEISGDGRIWFPVALSLLPVFRSPALLLLCGLVLDIILVGILKQLARRPRPVYNFSMGKLVFSVDHWSFPSGHSSRVAFITSLVYRGYGGGEGVVKTAVCGWAVATAMSRVLLGRHFMLDVVSGVCLGLIVACAVAFWFDESALYDYLVERLLWFSWSQ